jgi:hypothetical protein
LTSMEFSPRRTSLYRKRLFAATFGAFILFAGTWLAGQAVVPQYGRKAAADKGPRALGLIQLSPTGKARIIPITLMIDGKFYDAGSYKASPVPLALDFGVVYEGFRTGVSQGVFTITQPGQLNHNWIAEGKWLPAGAIDPNQKKKYAPPVMVEDDKDDHPVLHRRVAKTEPDSSPSGSSKDKNDDDDRPVLHRPADNKDSDNKDQQKTAATPSAPSPTPTASTSASPTSASPSDAAKTAPPAAPAKASADSQDETIADPNRPRLRRGKPDPSERHDPFVSFDVPVAAPGKTGNNGAVAAKETVAAVPPATLIPAISDAGGPDPRPYAYDVKPAEQAIYRNKMLELAAKQLVAQSTTANTTAPGHAKLPANKSGAKSAKPQFDDLNLRIFDLSSSNEPVLVLSARTHLSANSSEEPKEITLIARTDLEGELRKLFFSQTDSRHLDISPRMELIDAVDADGDGRGELLFRRTFDEGSAYAIYRVSADRLWPLFEGTP